MTILYHKPFLVKVTSTKGGGGTKIPKKLTTWFMEDHKEQSARGNAFFTFKCQQTRLDFFYCKT